MHGKRNTFRVHFYQITEHIGASTAVGVAPNSPVLCRSPTLLTVKWGFDDKKVLLIRSNTQASDSVTLCYCLDTLLHLEFDCFLFNLLKGTDEPDVKALNLAGLSAVPGDAPTVAINAAKYTCHSIGGKGAMREFAEHILLQKQKAKSQMEQDRIDRSSF